MKTCFIHIGVSKTGSSSIQKSLFDFFSRNSFDGFHYPLVSSVDAGVSHNALTCSIQKHSRLQRQYKYRFTKGELVEISSKYNDEFVRQLDNNIVVSSEYFAFFDEGEIRRLKDFFITYGYQKFYVLVYVRDPVGLYASAVQQQIKGSTTYTNPYYYDFSIQHRLNVWEKVFSGSDNMFIVRPFDKLHLVEGCVVKDALHEISKCFAINNLVDSVPVKRLNESLSLEALYVLKKYREVIHPNLNNLLTKDSGRLVNVLSLFKGTRVELLSSIYSYILDKTQEELFWLRDAYGVDFLRSYDHTGVGDVKEKLSKKSKRLDNLSDVFVQPNMDEVDSMLYGVINKLIVSSAH